MQWKLQVAIMQIKQESRETIGGRLRLDNPNCRSWQACCQIPISKLISDASRQCSACKIIMSTFSKCRSTSLSLLQAWVLTIFRLQCFWKIGPLMLKSPSLIWSPSRVQHKHPLFKTVHTWVLKMNLARLQGGRWKKAYQENGHFACLNGVVSMEV
jgi:hypothetical protein